MAVEQKPRLRVFLVDDSDDCIDLMKDLLAAEDCCEVVGSAPSEERAVEWSYQNEGGFDVAVLDLLLQEGSGFGVLTHLAKYQPGKVILLSEYVSPAITERALSMGAVAAFPKTKTRECVQYIRDMWDFQDV